MKLGVKITLLVLCLADFTFGAQDRVDGFFARTYRSNTGEVLPYRLYVPNKYDQAQKYPLIVWLHGGGGVGTDNVRQISGDQVFALRTWTKAETQSEHPAFVLAPQSPGLWATLGGDALTIPEKLTLEVITALQSEFSVDPKRIYISGQSLGGMGTWDLLSKVPDVFAAAVILCGPGNPAKASTIAKIPIWAFQGARDITATVSGMRAMIAAIRAANGSPKYTEYPKVGHDVWLFAFSDPALVGWLFDQHK